MSPITHFLTGWVVANASCELDRRERALITFAAVAPDLDGIGIIAEWLTRDSAHPLMWFSEYHHVLCHNLGVGILLVLIGSFFSTRRWITAGLIFLNFHLHLLSDLVGSRSPDGYQWPIMYLLPFSNAWSWTWNGQWELNAWPNFVITIIALFIVFVLSWKRGYSPLEMISETANKAFVETLQRRFPART